MSAQETANKLLEALVAKEKADLVLKETNATINSLTGKLNEEMFEESVDEITIQGIKLTPVEEQNFKLSGEGSGQKWDEYPAWFEYLKSEGEGGLIKTKESVPWNTRNKYLKALLDSGEALPEFIEQTLHSTIKWNKSAVKRMVNG